MELEKQIASLIGLQLLAANMLSSFIETCLERDPQLQDLWTNQLKENLSNRIESLKEQSKVNRLSPELFDSLVGPLEEALQDILKTQKT